MVLLALLAAAIWWLYRPGPRLRAVRQLPGVASEGGKVALQLRVELRCSLPTRVVVTDQPPRTLIASKPLQFGGLILGRQVVELVAELSCNRRGELLWPPLELRWSDPLGLFWRAKAAGPQSTLLVFPGNHPLALPELLRPLLQEGPADRRVGLQDPASLRGVREYRAGDPPNLIHWKQSAHHAHSQQLFVRELEAMTASGLQVHVDTRGDAQYLEAAVRLAASLLTEAESTQLPCAASAGGRQSPAGRDLSSRQAALALLARLRLGEGGEIPLPPAGFNLIVISQLGSEQLLSSCIRARNRAGRVVLILLPEGFYLEPGERPRPLWSSPPDAVRALERQARVLIAESIEVVVLRGDQSVMRLTPLA